jgi:hypothetical protein
VFNKIKKKRNKTQSNGIVLTVGLVLSIRVVGRDRGQQLRLLSKGNGKKVFHGRTKRATLLHSCLIRASTKMNTTPIALFCSFALLLVASSLQPAFASKCSDHLLTLKASDGQDSYGKNQLRTDKSNKIFIYLLLPFTMCRIVVVHIDVWQF